MTEGQISPWLPDQDRHRLAVLGKLIEECNELSARAARCIIQGIDEIDPDTGRTNHDEIARVAVDVEVCIAQLRDRMGVDNLKARNAAKSAGFDEWHTLIDASEFAATSALQSVRCFISVMKAGTRLRVSDLMTATIGATHEPKAIYNAATYLCRTGELEREGYGVYLVRRPAHG